MGFRCGIVGLPNVGKSTIFNAITATQNAQAANYPFCTIEPNVGVVAVPDPRLAQLAEIARPQKITPTTIEFFDIAGLVRGASKGEGLGNQFLSHIREVDAIAHVVRCFEDDDVVHVDGKPDPGARRGGHRSRARLQGPRDRARPAGAPRPPGAARRPGREGGGGPPRAPRGRARRRAGRCARSRSGARTKPDRGSCSRSCRCSRRSPSSSWRTWGRRTCRRARPASSIRCAPSRRAKAPRSS